MLRVVFILALVLALAALVYRALRPYIHTLQQFIATVRHFKNVAAPPAQPKATAEKLVQCETCGIWIPETRALMANSNDYCSRDCMKRSGRNSKRRIAG